MNDPYRLIDRALTLLDQLEELFSEVASSKDVSSGTKFNIYRVLVDLRDTLIELRKEVLQQ